MRTVAIIIAGLVGGLLGTAGPAAAGPVHVRSQHEQRPVAGADAPYLWLPTGQMLQLDVSGPTQLGLRLRQVLVSGRSPVPVDLTVVRDDREQGTVRFGVPPADAELSDEVLVRIDVPPGPHTYRVLVSGPRRGVLVQPFSGRIHPAREAIVATPGSDRRRPPEPDRPPPRRRRPEPKPLQAPEPLLLDPVPVTAAPATSPRSERLVHRPPSAPRLGPATRGAGALAGMGLLGATALAIASGVHQRRAEDAAVQLAAGAWFDRAERTRRAAAIGYGLAGAAAVAAVVLYFVERPEQTQPAGAGGVAVLRF
jgi:hypothetical protein